MAKKTQATPYDLARLTQNVSSALALITGVLCEVAGPALAFQHLAYGWDAMKAHYPDPLLKFLLTNSMQLATIKARTFAKDAPALRSLIASVEADFDLHSPTEH